MTTSGTEIRETMAKAALVLTKNKLRKMTWEHVVTGIIFDAVDLFVVTYWLMLTMGAIHSWISKSVPAAGYLPLLVPTLAFNYILDLAHRRNNSYLKRQKDRDALKQKIENMKIRMSARSN